MISIMQIDEAQHQAVVDHHPNHLQRHLPEMEGAQQSLRFGLIDCFAIYLDPADKQQTSLEACARLALFIAFS